MGRIVLPRRERARARQEAQEHRERRQLKTCYVCGHKISGEPVHIGGSRKHPEGLDRHVRCQPGSTRWLQTDHGQASELYPYFITDQEQ